MLILAFCLIIFYPTIERRIIRSTKTEFFAVGVVPHHLLAKDIIETFYRDLYKIGNPDLIILLSPDHYKSSIFLGGDFITSNTKIFKGLKIEEGIINSLKDTISIIPNNFYLEKEHGITNQIPFIKKYFPKSTLLPIIVSQSASNEKLSILVEHLYKASPTNTFVIASVDFSHYLPSDIAYFHDVRSIRALLNFEKENFKNIDVDSWQSLFIMRYFARLKRCEFPIIISHKNSNDYFPDIYSESTTSYFSVIFKSGENTLGEYSSTTYLFLGDIMLGRGVEKLIESYNPSYPFRNIWRVLRGVDYVIGNLEGAISNKVFISSEKYLRFCFKNEVVRGLRNSYINVLSLANNHSGDGGLEGLKETREILKKYGIIPLGDPILSDIDYIFSNKEIVILSFNVVFPKNINNIIKILQTVKKEYSNKVLVVYIHWGSEYEGKSNLFQKYLAHKLVDSGADIIIGTHPHVVQEIEIYKKSIIFYSVGNFVFDQKFEDTKKGIIIGLELTKNGKIFRIFPIKIENCQPKLMNFEDAQKFLIKLSEKSDTNIKSMIIKGSIYLE